MPRSCNINIMVVPAARMNGRGYLPFLVLFVLILCVMYCFCWDVGRLHVKTAVIAGSWGEWGVSVYLEV